MVASFVQSLRSGRTLTPRGGESQWQVIADERGSIIAHANATAAISQINKYDPYGIAGAGISGRFRYAGAPSLAGSGGLYHSRARAYSPSTGRFMQADPIGTAGGMNLYAYVGNDPVNFTDPWGLRQLCVALPVFGGSNDSVTFTYRCQELGLGSFGFGGFAGGGGLIGDRSADDEGDGGGDREGDRCRDQRNYLDNYADPASIQPIVSEAAEETSIGEFLVGLAGTNVNTNRRYIFTAAQGWVDLKHVVSAGYSGFGVIGWSPGIGAGVELGQSLFPSSTSIGQSGMNPSDFVSNAVGQAAMMNAIFGPDSFSENVADLLDAMNALTEDEARAALGNCGN